VSIDTAACAGGPRKAFMVQSVYGGGRHRSAQEAALAVARYLQSAGKSPGKKQASSIDGGRVSLHAALAAAAVQPPPDETADETSDETAPPPPRLVDDEQFVKEFEQAARETEASVEAQLSLPSVANLPPLTQLWADKKAESESKRAAGKPVKMTELLHAVVGRLHAMGDGHKATTVLATAAKYRAGEATWVGSTTPRSSRRLHVAMLRSPLHSSRRSPPRRRRLRPKQPQAAHRPSRRPPRLRAHCQGPAQGLPARWRRARRRR